jgi:hypothetical protein
MALLSYRIGVCDSLNVRLVGSLEGTSAWAIALSGQTAYIADYSFGLRIVDVSDPSQPHEIGHCALAGSASGIAVADRYAYVTCGDRLSVVDILDRANPRELACYATPSDRVTVDNQYAYVTYSGGLSIIDISIPEYPRTVGFSPTLAGPWGCAAAGRYVYVPADWHGVYVVDATDPTRPYQVASFPGEQYGMGIALARGCAFTTSSWWDGGWLYATDLSDPRNPRLLDALSHACDLRSIAVAGDYAYVTAFYNLGGGPPSLRVFDISGPANLREVGYHDLPSFGADAVAAAGRTAYVTVRDSGLRIYENLAAGIGEEDDGRLVHSAVQLLQNPVQDRTLKLRLTVAREAAPAFALYDAIGRKAVDFPRCRLGAGSHLLSLPLPALPPGTYILIASLPAGSHQLKVVLAK